MGRRECQGQIYDRGLLNFVAEPVTNMSQTENRSFAVSPFGVTLRMLDREAPNLSQGATGTKNPPSRRVAFAQTAVCTVVLGGYGWARTTDPGIMSAVL